MKTQMFKIPLLNLAIGKVSSMMNNEITGRPIGFSDFFGFGSSKKGAGLQDYKIEVGSLFAVYRMNSDTRNCVRKIWQNTGKSGFNLVSLKDPEKALNQTEEDEIHGILNSPESTHKTFGALLQRGVRDVEVCGNAYWVILRNDAKKAVGIQPADPRTMAIVADANGVVKGYLQRVMGAVVNNYEPNDIIHFKGEDDPTHEVFGLGKLEPIIWEARTDHAAMISNFKFFENNAVPSALYILDEKIPTEKLKAKFDEIKKHFGGAANYKKAGAIVGVKDIKMLNISQKDMDFLAGRKFTTDKICASFGVPKFLLGYTDAVNNNNGTEQMKDFFENTIVPIESSFQDNITMQFLVREGYDVAFLFNQHRLATAEELEARAEKLYKSGMITLRQAKKIMGQPISAEDEAQENFDAYIIHSGASAVLLEDVGVDPELNLDEE